MILSRLSPSYPQGGMKTTTMYKANASNAIGLRPHYAVSVFGEQHDLGSYKGVGVSGRPLCIDLYCGLGPRQCLHCGEALPDGCRPDKKFCSTRCSQRHWYERPAFPYDRACRACATSFTVATRDDANRQYCSRACAKLAARKGSLVWQRLHQERRPGYEANRRKKNTAFWRDQRRSERRRILEALGGACVVCGVSNPNWLHVDYIPTSKNERFRHSRSLKFVMPNIHLFRLLCANHHYELTLTGRIEGTAIVQ